MKRIVLLLLLLGLLSLTCAAQADVFTCSLPQDQYIRHVLADPSGELLVSTFQALYRVNPITGEQSTVLKASQWQGVPTLDENGALYFVQTSFDPGVIAFYRLSEDGSTTLCGQLEASESCDGEQSIICMGDQLYATANMGEQLKLFRCDTKTGDVTDCGAFAPLYSNDCGLFELDGAVATVCYDYNSQQHLLYRYDPVTKDVSREALTLGMNLRIQHVAQDASTGAYWVLAYDDDLSHTGLYKGSSLPALETVAAPVKGSLICPLNNDCMLTAENMIYSCRLFTQAKGELTVFGGRSVDDLRFTIHSGINVSTTYHSSIADILNTKNSDIDIIMFSSTDEMGLKRIREKGYFVDLSSSETLTRQVNRMYESISSHLRTQDGKLAAWPISIDPMYCSLERLDLLEAHGLQIPITFPELMDFFSQLEEEGVLAEEECSPMDVPYDQTTMLDLIMNRFILEQELQGKRLDFDNAELRALLQRVITELPKEDTDFSYELYPIYLAFAGYDTISADAIPAPGIGPDSPVALQTYTTLAIINPYSNHQAEAIQYLEFLSVQESATDYLFYADKTEPMINASVASRLEENEQELELLKQKEQTMEIRQQLEDLERQHDWLKNHLYSITPEDIAAWQKLAPQLVISEEKLYTDALQKLTQRLVDNNLSVDAFISECNKHMTMVYAEEGI